MFRIEGSGAQTGAITVNVRCPLCRHEGAFHGLSQVQDWHWQENTTAPDGRKTAKSIQAGMRRCPNKECNGLLFVVRSGEHVMQTYPPEVIDFDSSSLPPEVLDCLEEAVTCHSAGCYRAAALMVRRTLEELCLDKECEGSNLKDRINQLKANIVISEDLLQAADELRLLGNDAAHIEAKAYDAIEAEEVEVAIELTKELLKAVYQHTSLVARLRALKKPATG